ncbi:MAG TPA: efflux RND transporter periplasmic adaptor subunit [Paludibacter sp.]|nr:efflux RND transporter periplasmic adaptor subunit [Paludibacter sp.]
MKTSTFKKVAVVFSIGLMFLSCTPANQDKKASADKSGNKIVETGELAAIESKAFVMSQFGRMYFNMKIIGILKHGTPVKAGDSIIQLDPTDVKKFIIDLQGRLETQTAVIEKMKVDQNNKEQELASKLKNETATFDLRKLELEASRFESERIRKIKKLEFEQAKIAYAKAIREIKSSKVIMVNDMKIQLLLERQFKTDLNDAKNILPKLTIRTPISGIFQLGRNWRDEPLKIGDQIYPGQNMGNVPSLTWMKVNTVVNERDFFKIRKGQKVLVRLDAMPKTRFNGEITYIGKLCHVKDEKSRQKVFDVEVKMLKSDERLKPGMTVSCEYLQ